MRNTSMKRFFCGAISLALVISGSSAVSPAYAKTQATESIVANAATSSDADITSTETDALQSISPDTLTCNYTLTGDIRNYHCTQTPYDIHGKLSVSGTNLVDQNGKPVMLRGASLHGIQHTNGSTTAFKDYVNKDGFQILRDEWGVNLIRIPVYTAEGGYCQGRQSDMDQTIQKAVSLATELGMYIIIDWHILSDGNPQQYQNEAITFFRKYSQMYAKNDHVLYEICNEPNGTQWSNVKSYAKAVIPVIRANKSDSIIMCGTPDWSQLPHYNWDNCSDNPITVGDLNNTSDKRLAPNLLYSIHFYSATHYDNIQDNVRYAHNKGLPIFCTEFGICDATGNGRYDIDNADKWIRLLKEYNISFACWNLSNNRESSAMFNPGCTKLNSWVNADITTTGAWFINTVRPMYDEEMANLTPITVYNGVDYKDVYNYDFYTKKYPDIKKTFGGNYYKTLQHFVLYGMNEGRQGSAEFELASYKNGYADLRAAYGLNNAKYYLHYITTGKKDGRKATGITTRVGTINKLYGVSYAAVYKYSYYTTANADVYKVYGEDDIRTLLHFINNGMAEGRRAKSTFDLVSYKNANPDLRSAYGLNNKAYYMHYINFGYNEGRQAYNVPKRIGTITKLNGVEYKDVYNYDYYTTKYPDIKKAFGEDDIRALNHFINNGMAEARQGSKEFNVTNYAKRYSDLRKAFGSDYPKYYLHYINYGKKEGRIGK